MDDPAPPLLVVLSGPSGVGKDAVISTMRARGLPFHLAVTITTRPKRPGEIDGVDYFFTSQDRYDAMLAAGELLEHATVYGNCYGVPRAQVRDALAAGRDVLVKTDVQGAATIHRLAPEALMIFLAPQSMDELAKRLHGRRTESAPDLERRVATARAEMRQLPLFDYVVVNHHDRIDESADQVVAIVASERRRHPPRAVVL